MPKRIKSEREKSRARQRTIKRTDEQWAGYKDMLSGVKKLSTDNIAKLPDDKTRDYLIGAWQAERHLSDYNSRVDSYSYTDDLQIALEKELEIAAKIGSSPCTGCIAYLICGKLNLACRRFKWFVIYGEKEEGKEGEGDDEGPRPEIPTSKTMLAIFKDKDAPMRPRRKKRATANPEINPSESKPNEP